MEGCLVAFNVGHVHFLPNLADGYQIRTWLILRGLDSQLSVPTMDTTEPQAK